MYVMLVSLKVVDNISFKTYSGEILGIAGIAGSGQKELLETIAGLNSYESGTLTYYHPKKDKPVSFYHKTYKRVMELANKNAFKYIMLSPQYLLHEQYLELTRLVVKMLHLLGHQLQLVISSLISLFLIVHINSQKKRYHNKRIHYHLSECPGFLYQILIHHNHCN